MRIHYFQHITLETPGCILNWAVAHGHTLSRTAFFAREPLPAPDDYDWLIVMGGPMNVYEEDVFPWLKGEKAAIRAAVEAGKTVLGICLGAQLITAALGGAVTKGKVPEIGWHTVSWNKSAQSDALFSVFPRDMVVFQWHYDTFSVLPPDARPLASSAACAHQAYQFGDRVFGFQFHLENTSDMLRGYIEAGADEMTEGPTTQTPEQVRAHPEYIGQTNEWMNAFLTALERQTAVL